MGDDRARIGRRVKRLRLKAGYSQAELARRAFGTEKRQGDIAAIEGGKRPCGLHTATNLARHLGVTSGVLLGLQ